MRAALRAMMMALLVSIAAPAAASSGGEPAATAKREVIPGSELMTSQEREQYRQRIRAAGSATEEQKVRDEHYRRMQERARLQGLRLPEPAPQAK